MNDFLKSQRSIEDKSALDKGGLILADYAVSNWI
jgi:hypothetical protein